MGQAERMEEKAIECHGRVATRNGTTRKKIDVDGRIILK
jgi:hypothetical protein